METRLELLTGQRDRDGAEQADRRLAEHADHPPCASVASLLPGQQPGRVSDCAAVMALPTSSRM